MLTIIYIYLNFTKIIIVKTRHVDEMDWVLLRMPWAGLGLYVKSWTGFEQVTRQVHEEKKSENWKSADCSRVRAI